MADVFAKSRYGFWWLLITETYDICNTLPIFSAIFDTWYQGKMQYAVNIISTFIPNHQTTDETWTLKKGESVPASS